MWMFRHDLDGGQETILSFGVDNICNAQRQPTLAHYSIECVAFEYIH